MKVLSEEKVQELLKENKISGESFKKSFSVLKRPDEKTQEEKRLEAVAKQTAAIEKLSELLEKNLVSKDPDMLPSILQKLSQDKDLMVGNLGVVLKEHFEKLVTMFAESKPVDRPVRLPGRWKFNIHRDLQGRIESVEAEPLDMED